MSFLQLIEKLNVNERFVKPTAFFDRKVAYGTAGFRTKASDLDWVLYRMGLLAALRSISQDCQTIGCMITASHNPEEDNGCKLVDPLGDMLEEKWEAYATSLVNSNDLHSTLVSLCQNELLTSIAIFEKNEPKKQAQVACAHDTRPSCALLLDAFTAGAQLLQELVCVTNYGLLTTPQLHYMVRCVNTQGAYGEASEQGYYNKISQAFMNVWSMIETGHSTNTEETKYESDLYVDCANGVGAPKMKLFSDTLSPLFVKSTHKLNFHLFNESKSQKDTLNHLCGADHVKVEQKAPLNLPAGGHKYCSFDGDADRIVYFYLDHEQKFNLLDGDKIASLAATHLKELVEKANLSDRIRLSIVQTAYANGSSTDFIQNVMKVNVSCVPTGVKHLHHEAQKCDIGVYFEANGHGTVLFSPKTEQIIEEQYARLIPTPTPTEDVNNNNNNNWINSQSNSESLRALFSLKHLKDCINQTVGDAICDLLLVELILASRQLTIARWQRLYTDLPSRQLKVKIKDRTCIETTDAERRVIRPVELQSRIDSLVNDGACCKSGRAFVRPSGTEDVVRVYAEADTQENCDRLANRVAQLVFDLAGGVGNRP
jgi:phosphoacetylglucosamine mutase